MIKIRTRTIIEFDNFSKYGLTFNWIKWIDVSDDSQKTNVNFIWSFELNNREAIKLPAPFETPTDRQTNKQIDKFRGGDQSEIS